MITLTIYAESEQEADALVTLLVESRLIAHATISKGSQVYKLKDGNTTHQPKYIITAHTKALLFNKIEAFIAERYGEKFRVFSLPITHSNEAFSEFIRNHTENIP